MIRDGEEITDEEAEGILEDLIELGVVKDDEQKNSKWRPNFKTN